MNFATLNFVINWKSFYSDIAAESWPECQSFQDMRHLPLEIQQEIIFNHLSFLFETPDARIPTISILAQSSSECLEICNQEVPDFFHDDINLALDYATRCGNFLIKYHPKMECGGIQRAPLFLEVLKIIDQNKIYNHCLEWCSGPGFIGYSILSAGICSHLDLADVWKPSLDAAKLADIDHQVDVWHIRRLSDIKEKRLYDLIVGNPPWFPGNLLDKHRVSSDQGLKICREFFTDVKNYLSIDGIIILVLGQKFTGPGDYWQMLHESGLEMDKIFKVNDDWHWFMVVKHQKPRQILQSDVS